MEPELLSPRQAASELGVSESTMRRWCDQDLVPVVRTEGRHRRIARSALIAISQKMGITRSVSRSVAGRGGRLADPEVLGERLFLSLVSGEARTVDKILEDLVRSGMLPADICDDVIAPALRSIGEGWARGEVGIFEEHRATQILQASLTRARAAFTARAKAPTAICAALTGDPYGLAPIAASFVLSGAGYRAMVTGPDTPVVALIDALTKTEGVRIVAISIGCVPNVAQLAGEIRELSLVARQQGAAVVLGGHGLTRRVRSTLTADYFGDTMRHLADFAGRHRRRTTADLGGCDRPPLDPS